MKFRTRLIHSYCLISIIPVLIFFVWMTRSTTQGIEENIAVSASRSASLAGEAIDVYIDVHQEVMDYLIRTLQDEASLDDTREILAKRYEELMASSPNIVGLAVANSSDQFVGVGMKRVSRDPITDEKWFQLAVDSPSHFVVLNDSESKVVITNEAYSGDKIFSILGSGRVKNRDVVILMDIKKDALGSLIESVSDSQDSFVFVVDGDGNIVYTPVNPVVSRLDDRSLSLPGGAQERVNVDGRPYLLSSYEGSRIGWRFIGVTSLESQRRMLFYSYLILAIVTIVVLAVAVAASVKLADTFDRPIRELGEKMHLVEQGDLSVRANMVEQDEIGALGRTFDHMLDRMNVMLNEIQNEKQRTLQARLKSLQEQIKPHFLYNTLDTISWMARERDADDIVRLVEALTNMFRLGLSQGKDFITVREELGHVTNYLYIQSVRYGDKLTYEIDAAEDTMDMVIPKLILQPLVENSIYHGIKLKKGGGKILVKTEKLGSELILSVFDNGVGMNREKLNSLRNEIEAIENGENGSFGMTYVIERMKLFSGADFELTIDSIENIFTEVTVRIREKEDV